MNRFVKPALLLAAACFLLPACSQTKVPADLATSLRGVQSDLNSGKSTFVQTTNALKDLRDNRGSNVQPQFAAFNDKLTELESKVGGMQVSREITDDKAQAFFAKWDQQINQIQDQDVAQSARERQQDVMVSFQKLKAKIRTLRDAYRPYYSNCVDVRNTLTADMTAQGATIARPAINAAVMQSPQVLNALDDVNKTIDGMIQ
jgi:DNA repair exonuclease SbcCD ATPase subunit